MFVVLYLSQEFQAFHNCDQCEPALMYSFSNFNMILKVWITFDILRSSQMNKEYWVKSKQFISAYHSFHKELQLINYQDLTQDTLNN